MSQPTPPSTAAPVSERWRSSTAHLILIYGGFFLVWAVLLIAAINWQTYHYLEQVVDQILEQRIEYLSTLDRDKLPGALTMTGAIDLRGVMSYGLFDADGRYLAGNIDHLPETLPADGALHPLPDGVARIDGVHTGPSRGVAVRANDGARIVLTRETRVIDHVGEIIRNGFFWALSLSLIPGLIGGYLLARRPLQRVRAIETAVAPLMRGDLNARLPISDRRDELDMLASIVNRMLDRVESLIGEIKGVSDSIAHDLRTPLTRLRAQLYRLQRETPEADARGSTIERCIADTDSLLNRFRALLRISELEDLHRRAGFAEVDLREKLQRVHELFSPVAEEKRIAFTLELPAELATVQADSGLLFEAVSNLVDNAIKFTPPGGHIALRMTQEKAGPRIDVIDNGPGVPAAEREAVLHRFYRTRTCRNEHECEAPGYGLGLSIVAAIVKLHEYRFEIADADGGSGTRMSLYCQPSA
jgi:signal transduction histidine kinase